MRDGGLRQLWQRHLPTLHWQSIETGLTGPGVPDMNFCADGVEGWIEDKQTTGWTVDMRPEQVAWILRRSRAGGRVFVAVRRKCDAGRRREAADELWLIQGSRIREARDHGLGEDMPGLLGRWADGPSSWNWDSIKKILLR